MAVERVTGSTNPVTTGVSIKGGGDKDSGIVYVEGPVSLLKTISDFDQFAPEGMTVEDHTLETIGDGFGRIVVRCVKYGSGDASTTPTRTTWRITMAEVTTDLKLHPMCVQGRLIIELWLNTDPSKRFDSDGGMQYVDESGSPVPITDESAIRYIQAYMNGIENYVRHFPVLEKISYYKTLPGCSMNRNSTVSGTVSQFSADIDKWSVPDVKLSGYINSGWFKSGDNYEQGHDLIWTRTEQWTWTPDGQGSQTGWIYQAAETENQQS